MSKVFISNLAENDYSNVSSFGDPVYLTEGFVKFNNIPVLVSRLKTKLRVSDKDDFLLLVGNSFLCSVILMCYLDMYGTARILHFDKRLQENYRVLEVKTEDFFDIIPAEENEDEDLEDSEDISGT